MPIDRRHLLAGLAATALPLTARAGTAWDDDFEAFVAKGMKDAQLPGLSVAMVRGNSVAARGYGLADIATNRPVTADTIFHIASLSKTVTGTAMIMLFADGRFGLNDPIAAHLDFPVAHPAFTGTAITFRMLMTHTSGISDKVYYATPAFAVHGDPQLPLRDFLAGYLSPGGQWYDASGCYGAQPGTAWDYSNVAVALLGYLAERLGSPLKSLTQDRLFPPLGMKSTSWTYAGLPANRIATPYDYTSDAPVALPPTGYPDWPAGLLRTSAADFGRFLTIYTTGGKVSGRTYLPPDALKTMLTPGAIPVSAATGQALIWQVKTAGGRRIAQHTGGDPGASTGVVIDLDRGVTALAFANASGNDALGPFFKELFARLLDRAANA